MPPRRSDQPRQDHGAKRVIDNSERAVRARLGEGISFGVVIGLGAKGQVLSERIGGGRQLVTPFAIS